MKSTVNKIAVFISLILCYLTAYAYDFEVNGVYYIVNQDQQSCTVVKHPDGKYTGNIEIPPYVDYRGRNLCVNTLGEYCFTNCRLNSLTIPATVTEIKGWALTNDGLIYDSPFIDKLVFEDSEKAIHFLRDGGAVYSDDIKANEIYIGRSCIGGEIYVCDGTISFGNIPMSVESPIYFNIRQEIDTIIIPKSVCKISLNNGYIHGSYANTHINNLIITESDQKLDISGNISRITNFFVGRDIQNILSKDMDEVKFGETLQQVPVMGNISLKSITLPHNLTNIPDRFLSGCTGLNKILLPKSIVTIGTAAFENCSSLQYISLPTTSDIPSDCFNGCSKLQFIEGSDGISKIGENAFANSGLTYFNISKNLKEIKNNAFYGSNLKGIYFSSDNSTLSSNSFSNLNYLEKICYLPSPKEYKDNIEFSNVNYRETNLIVHKNWFDKFKDIEPWKNFWIIDTFLDNQIVKFRNETIGGEIGTGVLITDILTIDSHPDQIDYSTFELNSTDNEIASVHWPFIYFNGVGKCKIILSQKSNPETNEIQVIVKDYLPKEFEIDNVKYRRLEEYNVEVIEINTNGTAIIPANVEFEGIPFRVSRMAANIGSGVTSLTIPNSCNEIRTINTVKPSVMKELIIEAADTPISIGCGNLHVTSSITPFPNPSDVDERRTGFRNGYYDGLFYGLPIERLVINRDIVLPKYYERTIGNPTSYYSTVYNDIIYYPPFYGLSNLKYVEIGENVSTICKNQIEAVVNAVPTTMEYTNFGKCDNIEVVISNNPTAPVGGGFSQNTYENALLFLPNGGADSYKNDDSWKRFINIRESDFIPVTSISFENEEITMDFNQQIELIPNINPQDASINKLKWESSASNIVDVSYEGIIMSKARNGQAIITASTCDGSGISQSIIINVDEGAGLSEITTGGTLKVLAEDGRIIISGKSDSETVEIFNVQGQKLISTNQAMIEVPSKGIFIVKIASTSIKVIL